MADRPDQAEESQRPSPARIRIIGVGRWSRADDQAGLFVAQALDGQRDTLPAGTEILTTQAPGAELFFDLDDSDLLILIDAAAAAEAFPIGRCLRIDYRAAPNQIGAKCRTDTHSLSVDAALELGTQLGLLPETVWVYAIAADIADHPGYGEALSPQLSTAMPAIVDRVRNDIQSWLEASSKR